MRLNGMTKGICNIASCSAMREPFRSRSNTSSSGRIRDAEIEPHESRSREGSHGQG